MPRRPRLCPAGICFHVINRTVGRLTLFEKQEDYRHRQSLDRDPNPIDDVSSVLLPGNRGERSSNACYHGIGSGLRADNGGNGGNYCSGRCLTARVWHHRRPHRNNRWQFYSDPLALVQTPTNTLNWSYCSHGFCRRHDSNPPNLTHSCPFLINSCKPCSSSQSQPPSRTM